MLAWLAIWARTLAAVRRKWDWRGERSRDDASARERPSLVLGLKNRFGLGWVDLPRAAGPAEVVLRLLPEQVIRGRLIDLRGEPVQGATLCVHRIWVLGKEGTTGFPV